MGRLGWTYDDTLDTPMPAIHRAYDAQCEMLREIFGGGESSNRKPRVSSRTMTARLFDALWR